MAANVKKTYKLKRTVTMQFQLKINICLTCLIRKKFIPYIIHNGCPTENVNIPLSSLYSTVTLVKNGILLQKETEMMSVRWKIYNFFYQIPENEQVEIQPCGHCFVDFLFNEH